MQLESDLRTGELKGDKEDSAVVVRVLETYLTPMQEEMLGVAPEMQLATQQSRDRVKLLPLLMKARVPSMYLRYYKNTPHNQTNRASIRKA